MPQVVFLVLCVSFSKKEGVCTVKKIYRYSPKRDMAVLGILCGASIVVFYILQLVLKRYTDDVVSQLTKAYWFVVVTCVVYYTALIICWKKNRLTITETEVSYSYGVIVKQEEKVPISKIETCEINVQRLQKVFDTSSLTIYLRGGREIYIGDITNGEEACIAIMSKLR